MRIIWLFLVCILLVPLVLAQPDNCKRDCNEDYVNSISSCHDDYRETKGACIEDRRDKIKECRDVRGFRRFFCMLDVFRDYRNCLNDARSERGECQKYARDTRIECIERCENSVDILISEIDHNFVELYIPNSTGLDISGWYITTFDGDKFVIPYIFGLGSFDYVSIHFGHGINDLDASDGNAAVYFDVTSPLNAADEVGLYNKKIVDFVRYNGGNGDPVKAGWSNLDLGPSLDAGKSVQIHGPDEDSSANWVTDEKSEAQPNVFTWTKAGFKYQIHNGVNFPVNLSEYIFGALFPWDVHDPGGAFNLSDIRFIQEMLNYTYDFLTERGFNETLVTGADGDIDIHITPSGFGFASGSCDGSNIRVRLVRPFSVLNNSIKNKKSIEHEQVHLFQYARNSTFGRGSNFTESIGELEGQADFWGHEIAMAEFNVTFEHVSRTSGTWGYM